MKDNQLCTIGQPRRRWVLRAIVKALVAVAFGLASACVPIAGATVTAYDVIKGVYRFQNAEAPPVTGTNGNWYAYRRLFSNTANEFSAVTVTLPSSTVQTIPIFTSAQWLRLTQYASKAALDAAFQPGQYVFEVTSASSGAMDTGTVVLSETEAYALNAPSLTDGSFTRLGQHDWRTPLTINFPALQAHPAATSARMQIYLRDRSTNTERFLGTLQPATTSFTIFACSCRPSRDYQVKLVFNCSVRSMNAGFSGAATGIASYDQWVYVNFTTPPGCLADYDCSGGVSVQDVFSFLQYFFAGDARADINSTGGLSSQDIFDFLTAFFGGC